MVAVKNFIVYFECDFCHKSFEKKVTNKEFLKRLYFLPQGWLSFRLFNWFTDCCNDEKCQKIFEKFQETM